MATTAFGILTFRSALQNFKTTGTAPLVDAMSGKRFLPLLAWIQYVTHDAELAGPVLSIGNNATAYANICASQTAAGSEVVSGVQKARQLTVSTAPEVVDLANPILYNITTAAVPTTSTGYIHLIGVVY